MNEWTLYPVWIATALSIVGWLYFVHREYAVDRPTTLSDLSTRSRKTRLYFRTLMLVCPLLFAITGLWFVHCRLENTTITALWLTTIFCCMMAGIFLPTHGREKLLHTFSAVIMGLAMLALAAAGAVIVPRYNAVLWLIFVVMAALAIIGPRQKRHYIMYELGFIFLSHVSMVVIALAAV